MEVKTSDFYEADITEAESRTERPNDMPIQSNQVFITTINVKWQGTKWCYMGADKDVLGLITSAPIAIKNKKTKKRVERKRWQK